MNALNYDVTPLRGAKKVRISLITEKRGSVNLELSIPEILGMIQNLSRACVDIHKEEMEYLDTVKKESQSLKSQLYP
jgi:hypothetical protein